MLERRGWMNLKASYVFDSLVKPLTLLFVCIEVLCFYRSLRNHQSDARITASSYSSSIAARQWDLEFPGSSSGRQVSVLKTSPMGAFSFDTHV